MKKSIKLLLVTFLLSTVPSFAANWDDDYAKLEIFAGYNVVHIGGDVEKLKNMGGWNVAFNYNVNSSFGIKAEVAGAYSNYSISNLFQSIEGHFNNHSLMVGPQISWQTGRGRLFGHFLAGLDLMYEKLERQVHQDQYYQTTYYGSQHNATFAMALGGGVDISMGDRWAIRAAQFDYFPWIARVGGHHAVGYAIPKWTTLE